MNLLKSKEFDAMTPNLWDLDHSKFQTIIQKYHIIFSLSQMNPIKFNDQTRPAGNFSLVNLHKNLVKFSTSQPVGCCNQNICWPKDHLHEYDHNFWSQQCRWHYNIVQLPLRFSLFKLNNFIFSKRS